MILHIFECSKCQRQQKHVTSTPSPLGLSYMSECATCNKIQTFKFIREGNRKEDWYTNTLRQINKKKSENQSDKARRKNDDIDRVAI
ncbi:MAG: hypothetical protein HN472_10195 [Nitrospina sp.]|nr:hypothetical protein [Nitrospina sp.]MBT3874473.1 hypothetical protein [Nitrospina sp.]MBT4049105.1 hypothetical protein [Nitrospina sp.]MBT4559143.1 hypothetical protein [Nitrospina sp.]MBT5347809.1 hypothetical protein [Nitrospina sp.]